MSHIRRACFVSGLAIFAAVSASAQSSTSANPATQFASGESSSSTLPAGFDDGLSSATALRTAAASLGSGSGASAGQDENGGGGGSHGLFHNLAFEAGGGFNGPAGDSSNYITWGGNFTVGGGLHLNKRFSVLAEYQFLDDKLPGAIIAETGATGGNAHIWSLTLDPVVDLFPKSTNSVYVTGGGGFYRKVTNFTDPEEAEYCEYYYCGVTTENEVVGHFSSNQGGFNIGGGYTHRLGGVYGDGQMKLFAEVRYLDVMTPASAIAPNGLGTATVGSGTKLIPITLGVRW
jgi:hypothetical protein